MVKAKFFLDLFNVVMEKHVLPWRVKKREGDRYRGLRFSTVHVVLHNEELEDLNNPLVSDLAKARIIAEGIRRNVVAQQPLVEPA